MTKAALAMRLRKSILICAMNTQLHTYVDHEICNFLCNICYHSVHCGINPPSKTPPPPLSCQAPPKIGKLSKPPLFRQSPLYIGFREPLPPQKKVGFFSEPRKH